jgi:hypothetical protein
LNLSGQTVKNHVHRILRKVGVTDRLSISEVFQNQYIASGAARASGTASALSPAAPMQAISGNEPSGLRSSARRLIRPA